VIAVLEHAVRGFQQLRGTAENDDPADARGAFVGVLRSMPISKIRD